MIPWVVGRELRATLLDYLRSTWSLADGPLEEALFRFLSGKDGIFQGPYLKLGLPFSPAPEGIEIPLDIRPPHRPHLHQLQAWQRLSSRGQMPRATLITTGTGSGKTECFLYPLLDHAHRESMRKTPGIKAIVLYPMNALASDQAARFARAIWDDERLRGNVRVGLFVGGEEGRYREMGPDHVIDNNDRLRSDPPDILLTNYRMLDLLLQRPKDTRLWAQNAPDALRYLVLDELHTYDGAQGTDVACLIRRLATRLGSGEHLCAVGTSATVGGAAETKGELLKFAETLFDQKFWGDAFIGESRLTPAELATSMHALKRLEERVPTELGPWPQPGEHAETHIEACMDAWLSPKDAARLKTAEGIDRAGLGEVVMRLPIVQALLESAHQAPRSVHELDAWLTSQLPSFATHSFDARQSWIASALSLMSYAKRKVGTHELPLVSVQVTLWVREVRRLLARVGEAPVFRFLDDSPPPDEEAWLPRYHCADCGHGGWLVTESGPGDTLGLAYQGIARAFQERADDLRLLHIDAALSGDFEGDDFDAPDAREEKAPRRGVLTSRTAYLDAVKRRLLERLPEQATPEDIARMPKVNVATFEEDKCPACGGRHTLRILASRATTLSSVAVGHLFTTPLNTDRKLLTFSDSVQDAAHRAGFFGARTFRFAMRSAVLAAVPKAHAPEGISLASLGDAAWEHWVERLTQTSGRTVGLSPVAELTALLLPVDMHWLSSVQDWHAQLDELVQKQSEAERDGQLPDRTVPEPSPKLIADVKTRLRWECTRELGVAARIGRTLEQSGCVSVTVDAARFDRAVEEMAMLFRERLGLLLPPETSDVAGFVSGLITRVRLRGGVLDPLLEGYVANAGNGFFLSKQKAPLLSPFTRDSSRPVFLTNAPKAKRFESLTSTHKGTWAIDWLVRSLGLQRDASVAADVYAIALQSLAKSGLFAAMPTDERGPGMAPKATAWGLNPDALLVSRAHVFRNCNACGYALACVEGSVTDVLARRCIRYRCAGTFEAKPEAVESETSESLPVASYYKRFYEGGNLGRLWSREHTGLLARASRESLELEFKNRPRPDSPNLLSCTPTLEMGIDIGDLSATLLCSVPPKASNYIQRVGRAGRKTGNALVLAFAATRPHDLYFFQAPLEAMAGTVQPPGCYLSAPEVLKRQAMAFAFDGYAKRGGTLPGRVGDLWNPGERKKFPEPVVDFIKPQREKLQSAFVEMFRNDNLNETARRYIAAYLTPEADGYSPLERALVTVTADTRTKREALRELVKKLTARELELKGETTEAKRQLELDDERHRVVDELKFTSQQLGAMGKKDLFGWLTEEGCLPNYAFPERGVKLDAFIRREGVGREPEHHEWVRAPANALTELAPFNTFYASSRRVTIDGIELKRSQKPVDWRFCRTCHHAEVATSVGEVGQACPSCGDAHFADVGLRRGVVTMGQVFAVAKHRDAVLGDDGDDRDRSFYERATLFSAQAKARDAWSNEARGFGFELQDAMVMRELNLGKKQDKGTPQTFRLAGKDVPDVRFTLCEDCGQAHLPGPANHIFEKPRDKHRAWCPERKKPEEKQRFREVHLMRELKSEALRLVVPVSDSGDAGVDMANLKAALRLGLRRFYGGEPEFLQVAVYDEPLHEGEGKRRYLVVMDRVPGGTGLLTELALNKGRSLHEALTHASNMLRTCACQKREPAAKACYQCLYAYREQESLPFLERARALELVDTLIDAFASLKKVDSIGTMDQSQVLESELEHRFHARFIDEIRSDGGRVEEANESTWKITYGGRGWLLRAQVELDRSQVEVPSRADFILYPEPLDSDPKGIKLRPIAIYTDGLAYHVCPSQAQARLGMDARQREAIAATDTMLSWSLSWKDVVSPKEPPVPTWLGDGTQYGAFVAFVQQVATARKAPEWNHLLRVLDSDPLKGLLAVMKAPFGLAPVAQLAALLLLQKGRRKTVMQSYEDMVAICDSTELPSSTAHLPSEGDIATRELVLGEFAHLRMSIPNGELNGLLQKTGNLQVALRLEDQAEHRKQPAFESSWRQWLRAWNLLQALPGARMVTQEAIAKRVEADVPVRAMTPVEAPVRNEKALQDLLRNLDVEDLKRVLAELLTKHPSKPLPTIPFELRRPAWRVDKDVEVAFEGERVALYFDAQREGAAALEDAGWDTVAIDRGMDLEALEDVLGWSEG